MFGTLFLMIYMVNILSVQAAGYTLILMLLSSHPGIPPCTIPPIDTLTDTTFEYSVLANVLLVSDKGSTILD